jgi:hypothetical protein
MANVVKHRFASPKVDGADATQVQPSHWNDGHTFTGGAAGDLLTRDPTDALYGAKWGSPAPSFDAVILNADTGTLDNWAPAGLTARNTYVHWAGTAAATISGIAGGVDGQVITIKNRTTNGSVLSCAYFSDLSAAANRLVPMVRSAPTPIAEDGFISFIYVAPWATWFCIAHEQGSWITPPFNAANFSSSTGAWTVAGGNVYVDRYRLSGRTLSYSLQVYQSNFTVAGIARRTLYGFQAASYFPAPIVCQDAAGAQSGYAEHYAAQISFYRLFPGLGFNAGALSIYTTNSVEVT